MSSLRGSVAVLGVLFGLALVPAVAEAHGGGSHASGGVSHPATASHPSGGTHVATAAHATTNHGGATHAPSAAYVWWAHDVHWGGWQQGYLVNGQAYWPRWQRGGWAWILFSPVYAYSPTDGTSEYYWYYCDSADAYYPDVTDCAEDWQLIPADDQGQ